MVCNISYLSGVYHALKRELPMCSSFFYSLTHCTLAHLNCVFSQYAEEKRGIIHKNMGFLLSNALVFHPRCQTLHPCTLVISHSKNCEKLQLRIVSKDVTIMATPQPTCGIHNLLLYLTAFAYYPRRVRSSF